MFVNIFFYYETFLFCMNSKSSSFAQRNWNVFNLKIKNCFSIIFVNCLPKSEKVTFIILLYFLNSITAIWFYDLSGSLSDKLLLAKLVDYCYKRLLSVVHLPPLKSLNWIFQREPQLTEYATFIYCIYFCLVFTIPYEQQTQVIK